jgi:DNA modification methylase
LQLRTCPPEEGDLILDPFLGSGTTAVAAYELGRRFIGIEKELKYVSIAKRRLDAVMRQGNLFREAR